MKRRHLLVLLLSLVLGLVAPVFMSACAPKAQVEEEKEFKVCLNVPLSGAYAGWGWVMRTAAEIWVDQVNADGGLVVGGDPYMVDLVRYDNQFDPSVAQTLTRKALGEGIRVFLVTSDGEAKAMNSLCQSEEALLFATGVDLMSIIGPDSPYTFQNNPEGYESVSTALIIAREEYPEYTKIGALAPDDDRGHSFGDILVEQAEQLGFSDVTVAFAPPEESDFYSVLTPLMQKDVDVLVNLTFGYAQGGLIIKQARELGFEKLVMFTDTIDVPTVADVCGVEALEGTIATPELAHLSTDVGEIFEAEFANRYGSFTYWGTWIYDTLLLLQAAIEEVDSLDMEKVMEAMDDVEVVGATGPVSFGTNMYTNGMPRYLKMETPGVVIRNGEKVDIFSGYSGLWD